MGPVKFWNEGLQQFKLSIPAMYYTHPKPVFLSMFLDFWNSYSLKYLFKAASVFCKVYQNLHDVT